MHKCLSNLVPQYLAVGLVAVHRGHTISRLPRGGHSHSYDDFLRSNVCHCRSMNTEQYVAQSVTRRCQYIFARRLNSQLLGFGSFGMLNRNPLHNSIISAIIIVIIIIFTLGKYNPEGV